MKKQNYPELSNAYFCLKNCPGSTSISCSLSNESLRVIGASRGEITSYTCLLSRDVRLFVYTAVQVSGSRVRFASCRSGTKQNMGHGDTRKTEQNTYPCKKRNRRLVTTVRSSYTVYPVCKFHFLPVDDSLARKKMFTKNVVNNK